MADTIVINKADGDNITRAKNAKVEFSRALHLYPPKTSGWIPTVSLCSALENTGIEELWKTIEDFVQKTKTSGHFESNRIDQNKQWLKQTIEDRITRNFYNRNKIKIELIKQIELIEAGKTTPFAAADYLLSL